MSGEKETIDKQLLDCCTVMLSILLNQYKSKIIDITDFKRHSTNKISYILSNYELEKNNEKRKVIDNLIKECNEIISQN